MFSHYGGYASPQTFVDGLKPAIFIGALFVAVGAVAAFGIPKARMALNGRFVDTELSGDILTGAELSSLAVSADD